MKLGLGNAWLKLGASLTTYLVTTNTFAADLGTLVGTAKQQSSNFGNMVQYGAYGVGSIVGIRGVMLCKAHAENPGNVSLNKGVAHLAGAAGCMAAPYVISNALGTIGATGAGSVTSFQTGGF